jgi:lipid-A-disaccharide synthase
MRLGLEPEGALVALLPGSRADEVRRLGAPFLGAAAELRRRHPAMRFVLPVADRALAALLAPMVAAQPTLAGALTLVDGRSHDCLEAADAVLVASGTATLEAALFQRPMVIAYRMPRLSAWLTRRSALIDVVGLPNILAGERLVPELLQEAATPRALADALEPQLMDPALRTRLAARFAGMHAELRRDTPALAAAAILETAR